MYVTDKQNMNKQWRKIGPQKSLYIRMLHQEAGVPSSELARRFPEHAQRTVYRHASLSVMDAADKRKRNPGRPKKLNDRDERNLIRALKSLRKSTAYFSARKIQEEANLPQVSLKTIRRVLHKHGYRYLQSRKKGLMYPRDKLRRVAFARKGKEFEKTFWEQGVSFYFDGVGFAHKVNPCSEARAAASMAWRKPSEGLERSTKGKKEGSGGKMANFFVAIAHGHGVVLCKQYEWTVTGDRFATFVLDCFPAAFEKCGVQPQGKLFLQDGDPRQTSKAARKGWESLGCDMFAIPARSPDLNPIENIFHLVRNKLKEDAISREIVHETYKEFCARVAATIVNFSPVVINKTIESMPQRMDMIVKARGERIRY